jgi:hypothetical protein
MFGTVLNSEEQSTICANSNLISSVSRYKMCYSAHVSHNRRHSGSHQLARIVLSPSASLAEININGIMAQIGDQTLGTLTVCRNSVVLPIQKS